MSDRTTLDVPLPYRRNPHGTEAADLHRRWIEQHAEFARGTDRDTYTLWDVTDLAAVTYPDCAPADLALAADLLGFYFLFDDQFDGELGRHPSEVARICDRLTAILHGAHPDPGRPSERAFADLWSRSTETMSDRWRARAAYNWEWYLASHPAEAAGRVAGGLPDRQDYLVLRRGTAAMETIFDMVERLGRFEVPQAVLHHPVLRQLRQLAADIPSLSNDVRSYPQEHPRGDVYNLVLIVQQERSCSAEEACAVVLTEAQSMIDRFAELTTRLPDVHRQLELPPDQVTATRRYVDGLSAWLSGYLNWEGRTGRYRPSPAVPSA